MARAKAHHVCQSCGAVHAKWAGRCESCGAWNSLVEEAVESGPARAIGTAAQAQARGGRPIDFVALAGAESGPPRRQTGIAELDRVAGGGLVPGSALLVGGDPGIGKSTLMLQVACAVAGDGPAPSSSSQNGDRVAYISGEEAIDQLRLRARRLGVETAPVALAAATSVRDLLASLDRTDAPGLVIIDSIQTMHVDLLESAPGTVAQVRASAQELIRLAKRRGLILVLIGHVTKEGQIAGPRVLEHMVDSVLYFEGDRGHQFRILRAVKNRFGPTDEIGVFEMAETGLVEVANPSAQFLAERRGDVAGACVFAGIEGTRPVLVEIQALVAPSSLGTPRRAVVGWEPSRLAMVMAVLETRCGLSLGPSDVYLNVAGGLRIQEPAADLAVAVALMSAVSGVPVPEDAVIFGEIGLSGEIRSAGQAEARLKEAAKLGFGRALIPAPPAGRPAPDPGPGIEIQAFGHLADLVPIFAPPT